MNLALVLWLIADVLTGAIDVQAGALNGQVSVGRSTAALNATLTDAGPDGQFNLAAPGLFASTATVSHGSVEAQAALCFGAQEITLSGTRGSGLHIQFQQTDGDPAACAPPSTAPAWLSMGPYVELAQEEPTASPPSGDALPEGLQDGMRRLLVLSLISGLLLLFVPSLSRPLSAAARTPPWSRFGLGLCLVLTLPVISVLVFIMGLGAGLWWVGLLILALYVCLLAISMAVAGLVLGAWLVERVHEPRIPPVAAFAAGLAILTLLGLLPSVGGVVNMVAVLFGAGVLMLAPRAEQAESASATDQLAPPGRRDGQANGVNRDVQAGTPRSPQ